MCFLQYGLVTQILLWKCYGNRYRYCDVDEMWGNYFGNRGVSQHYFTGCNNYQPVEKWYNPGFLQDIESIHDIDNGHIYYCLTSSTNTFEILFTIVKTF